jgi:hypothetical protein
LYGGGTYALNRRFDAALRVKDAVTERAAVIVTVHVPVPEQSPDQPVKRLLRLGVAVRTTAAPSANWPLQDDPHLIPAGWLLTTPEPVPRLDTVRARRMGAGRNVAVTE